MRWTPWIIGSLCVAALAGCNGSKRANTGAAGTESGAMQGTATDTGTPPAADTGMRTDTSKSNQGQPVTSKGDTVTKGGDTASKPRP